MNVRTGDASALAGIRARQMALLTEILTAGKRLRTAMVAGDLAAMQDVAAQYEDLLDSLDHLEGQVQVQRLSGAELSDRDADECDRLKPGFAALMRELQAVQDENRLLLRRAHERTHFRLQLITNNTRRPQRFVDRRA